MQKITFIQHINYLYEHDLIDLLKYTAFFLASCISKYKEHIAARMNIVY